MAGLVKRDNYWSVESIPPVLVGRTLLPMTSGESKGRPQLRVIGQMAKLSICAWRQCLGAGGGGAGGAEPEGQQTSASFRFLESSGKQTE